METKNETMIEIPSGYALCMRDDCAVCQHCLRHLAYKKRKQTEDFLSLVTPLRTESSEKCKFFRSDALATYAKGFTRMQQEMLPRQYQEFMIRLIGKFGRTGYFERRRGERLCTPKEIEIVRSVLQELGLPQLEFDNYLQKHNFWD